jgi:Na+-driven multidrug efflux pump
MVLAEIVGIIMYTLAPALIGLFSDEVEVINIGVLQSRTICLFYFLLAFSHCIVAVCRGAGKAFFTMLIMLIVWCGIRVLYITIAMNINHTIIIYF